MQFTSGQRPCELFGAFPGQFGTVLFLGDSTRILAFPKHICSVLSSSSANRSTALPFLCDSLPCHSASALFSVVPSLGSPLLFPCKALAGVAIPYRLIVMQFRSVAPIRAAIPVRVHSELIRSAALVSYSKATTLEAVPKQRTSWLFRSYSHQCNSCARQFTAFPMQTDSFPMLFMAVPLRH